MNYSWLVPVEKGLKSVSRPAISRSAGGLDQTVQACTQYATLLLLSDLNELHYSTIATPQ